ncbi:MAG: hypothetical protein ACRDN9_12525 [Streptosporangiaceae bacterium]
MNNDETEILPTTFREDAFDVVMRGYQRHQVDDYMTRTKQQIEELQARVAQAEQEVYEARRDAQRTSDETATLKRQLENYEPTPDELGERLTHILRLGKEEADEKRTQATAEAERVRGQAQEEAGRLRTEAKEEADRLRAEVTEEAERARGEAREETEKLRNDSREYAERLRGDAEQHAQHLVADAEERARQTEEGAHERVRALGERHDDLMERLSSAHASLRGLLKQQGAEEEEEVQAVDDSPAEAETVEPGEETTTEAGDATAVQQPVEEDGPPNGATKKQRVVRPRS